MKFLAFVFTLGSILNAAQPKCEIKHHNSFQKLGTVTGLASGFQSGKVYVTLTQGDRKYTTIAQPEGHWALSFADLELESKVLCWQQGTGLTAEATLTRN